MTMKKEKGHFPHYTLSLIGNARRLRRDMTDAERRLWGCLRGNQMGLRFRRQVPYDRYILDFYCPKAHLIIEVDGGQHYTEDGIERDKVRDAFLQQHGLKILRFSDLEVLKEFSAVQQKIYDEIRGYLEKEDKERTPP